LRRSRRSRTSGRQLVVDRAEHHRKLREHGHQDEDHHQHREAGQEARIGQRRDDGAAQFFLLFVELDQLLQHLRQEAASFAGADQVDVGGREQFGVFRQGFREALAGHDVGRDVADDSFQARLDRLFLQHLQGVMQGHTSLEQQREAFGEQHAVGAADASFGARQPRVRART
jgi:hypothetical protein